jgi:hypothetical protein
LKSKPKKHYFSDSDEAERRSRRKSKASKRAETHQILPHPRQKMDTVRQVGIMADIIQAEETRKKTPSIWRKIQMKIKASRPERRKSRMRSMPLNILIHLTQIVRNRNITAATVIIAIVIILHPHWKMLNVIKQIRTTVDSLQVEEARKESDHLDSGDHLEVKALKPKVRKSKMRNMSLHIPIHPSLTQIIGSITTVTVIIMTTTNTAISCVESTWLSD